MTKCNFFSGMLALLVSFSVLNAQDQAKTLFNKDSPFSAENLGFMIAPTYGLTFIDESMASLVQLRAGLNISDRISVGAYGTSSINQVFPASETLDDVYMDYWSAGAFVEYTLKAKEVWHLSFPVYLGMGEVQMDNEAGDARLGEAQFFQVEPAAMLELNLIKNLRFNLGAGYRVVSDMQYRNLNQADLSGFTAYIGLKAGLFK